MDGYGFAKKLNPLWVVVIAFVLCGITGAVSVFTCAPMANEEGEESIRNNIKCMGIVAAINVVVCVGTLVYVGMAYNKCYK